MRAVLIVLCAALVVAGCGRRGAPATPPPPPGLATAPVDPSDPDGRQVPDRPFVLDPLLN